MDREHLIPLEELCSRYSIERAFVSFLDEAEIVRIVYFEEKEFIDNSNLNELEKMMRLHYDLGINYEGLDAISHLLRRMHEMEKEIRTLRNRFGA